MKIKEEIELQSYYLMRSIKEKSLLLEDASDLKYFIKTENLPFVPPAIAQRLIVEKLAKEGLLEAKPIHYIKDSLGVAKYLESVNKKLNITPEPIGYEIRTKEPTFTDAYKLYENQFENLVNIKLEKEEEKQWIIFKSENFTISCFKGDRIFFMVNRESEAFLSLNKASTPYKLWEAGYESRELYLSGEKLTEMFGVGSIKKIRDAVNKTHRRYFLKALKKYCAKKDIEAPVDKLEKSILHWQQGSLRLVQS